MSLTFLLVRILDKGGGGGGRWMVAFAYVVYSIKCGRFTKEL